MATISDLKFEIDRSKNISEITDLDTLKMYLNRVANKHGEITTEVIESITKNRIDSFVADKLVEAAGIEAMLGIAMRIVRDANESEAIASVRAYAERNSRMKMRLNSTSDTHVAIAMSEMYQWNELLEVIDSL